MPWSRIAWRRNDRPSSWQDCEGAAIPYDAARDLLGNGNRLADPAHLFAHQIDGVVTYLVWQPARRA
jgi:hypothetical protein